MPHYLIREGDRYHMFSTIVMDIVTEELDSESMGAYLTRENYGRARRWVDETWEPVGGPVTPAEVLQQLRDAIVWGSDDWYDSTGGAYMRPSQGLEPVIES